MASYFKVKKWSEMQHYKDREPPWIKLYNGTLEDYEFTLLDDHQKFQLIAIYLLASRTKNKIPFDASWIKKKIDSDNEIDLDRLLELGFIEMVENVKPLQGEKPNRTSPVHGSEQHASKALQEPYREDREYREDLDNNPPEPGKPDSIDKPPQCPHQEIVNLYHEILPELPGVRDLTDARKSILRTRWRSHERFQSLDWWRDFFELVKESGFLMGRKTEFHADFDFLIRANKFQKIVEGGYQDRQVANG